MHFGAALRLLRVDAGISLRGLAEEVGVSSAYLSRVENGHDAPPTADRLVALAEAIGIPASLPRRVFGQPLGAPRRCSSVSPTA